VLDRRQRATSFLGNVTRRSNEDIELQRL
jgi:hypothetical protein